MKKPKISDFPRQCGALVFSALGAIVGLIVGLLTLPESERNFLKKERSGKKLIKNKSKNSAKSAKN